MPTNYSGRITLICTVLILSLLAIFWGPPSRLFNPNLTLIQKTDLRPGIYMVGGVSLADFAHSEAYVNQHPIAGNRRIVLKQSQIHPPANPDHINQRKLRILRVHLHDFPWDR